MIAVLCGGTGAARLVGGLVRVIPPEDLFLIGNVGDNIRMYGLAICPDLDTLLYALTGLLDSQRGWGILGDSFRCHERLEALFGRAWFGLGDLDMATHLYRTKRLQEGVSLSKVTKELTQAYGIKNALLPSTDSWVETHVLTEEGEELHYEEFFVKRACEPPLKGVFYKRIERALPAPEVLEVIDRSSAVILAPSNPLASILPIVRVPGIKEALASKKEKVWAVSPIIENAPLPEGEKRRQRSREKLLKSVGLAHTPLGVACLYQGFAGGFVLDIRDEGYLRPIEVLGYEVVLMRTDALIPRRQNELANQLMRAIWNRLKRRRVFIDGVPCRTRG